MSAEVSLLKNIRSSSGKVLFTLLIVVVVVAVAAGAGIYFKVIPLGSAPEPEAVVTRHKIPSPAGQTASKSAAGLLKTG